MSENGRFFSIVRCVINSFPDSYAFGIVPDLFAYYKDIPSEIVGVGIEAPSD
jgi:hypothetical protein